MEKRKESKVVSLEKGERKRSDGRYEYRYSIIDLSGNRKRKSIICKTITELRAKAKKVKRDIEDGIQTDAGKMTLNQVHNIDMELKDLRATTRANYTRMWNCRIAETLGKMHIADIKPLHIERFYKKCSEDGLKRNSISSLHIMIYGALELAVDNDYIRKNPSKNAMKKISVDVTEKIPLEENQVISLLEYCNKSPFYSYHVPFLTIAFSTCMRVSELCGLTWNDVDLENNTVSVNHQLVYINHDGVCDFRINEPKTKSGVRTIPFTESVRKAFFELKAEKLKGRYSTATIDGYTDFVFVSKKGQPYAVNGINSFLHNLEKAYNKDNPDNTIPHLSAHILRHTGCTILATKGIDIKSLQNIMGHSDASVTMNVYNHSSLKRTTSDIERIGEVIGL